MADAFTGEADFRPYKLCCDVLLNGNAYAPGGQPVRKVKVAMQVGPLSKAFNVVGPRHREAGYGGIGSSPSGAFEVMSISYDEAFGGPDNFQADESKRSAYMANPVGRG